MPSAAPSIPDYELLRLVGRGAYGDVWLARGVTGLFRAIKIVWRERFSDAGPYEREFKGLKEFAAISLLESRQLALLHVGRHDADGFFYYVMELADDAVTGREIDPARYVPNTLKEVRARRGRLPAAEVVGLSAELTRALAGLHARGLVHRDVKPSNVILVGGVPKLADIGLVASSTAAHTFVGTEGYLPPEGPGAPAADVFSLGKLLYELATGLDRRDFPRLPPDFPAFPDRKLLLELNEILLRACAAEARQRYRDAQALLDDILLLQAGRSVRRLRSAERRLARALRVAAVLALVAAVAGVGVWLEHQRAAREMALRRQAELERDDFARKSIYTAGLARAQRALETGDLGRARGHLRDLIPVAGQPDLRGFEWPFLWREAQGDPADVLRETGPVLQHVHLSPDGKLIAGQSADLIVTLWDTATLHELRRVDGVFSLAGFSADGRWLVGANRNAALQRWSIATGAAETSVAPGVNRALRAVGDDLGISFVDGDAGAPHQLRVWSFSHRTPLLQQALPADPSGASWDFYRGAVSPDGTRVALALINGRAQSARWKLVVLAPGSAEPLFQEAATHRLTALAFSGDGRRLAVAFGNTAEVALLDLGGQQWLWRRPVGSSQTNVLAFSPDETHLAAGGRDPLVRLLDSATGATTQSLRGHQAGIADLAWLPDRRGLVSAGTAGDLRWWRSFAPPAPLELAGLWQPAGGGRHLCLSADGRWLAANDDPARGALVWSIDQPARLLRVPGAWIPIAFSPDGATLLGLRPAGTLQRWQIAPEFRLLAETPLFGSSPAIATCTALPPGGTVLAVGRSDGQVDRWQEAARATLGPITVPDGNLLMVAVSPDGSRIVAGGADRTRALLFAADGRRLANLASGASALCGAFSPDGRTFALGWSDGALEIRAADTGQLLHRTPTESAQLQSLAFSRDGQRLVAGAPRGTLHVFATDDGREVVAFRLPATEGVNTDTAISDVALSADDGVLAAYVNDGRIRLWRR